MGIGVGMATNIPTHNLREVINATIYLMEHPTATTRELMTCLPGPDFPTGAIICGVDEIRKMYETGHGVLKIRAKADIVEKNGKEYLILEHKSGDYLYLGKVFCYYVFKKEKQNETDL